MAHYGVGAGCLAAMHISGFVVIGEWTERWFSKSCSRGHAFEGQSRVWILTELVRACMIHAECICVSIVVHSASRECFATRAAMTSR